jgi:isopentenyl-diphosphate delta-isomerase
VLRLPATDSRDWHIISPVNAAPATVELVTLVDPHDNVVGVEEKLRAHREGKLHRAFSVFVFDRDRNLLIQRRASDKYHSAGLWSNTCCGHPRPGETTERAASRRLAEEMGFHCPLQRAFQLQYRAELENAMIEHEIDQVLVGRFDGTPLPDQREVAEFRWIAPGELRERIAAAPANYTSWLQLLLVSREWRAVDDILARR